MLATGWLCSENVVALRMMLSPSPIELAFFQSQNKSAAMVLGITGEPFSLSSLNRLTFHVIPLPPFQPWTKINFINQDIRQLSMDGRMVPVILDCPAKQQRGMKLNHLPYKQSTVGFNKRQLAVAEESIELVCLFFYLFIFCINVFSNDYELQSPITKEQSIVWSNSGPCKPFFI